MVGKNQIKLITSLHQKKYRQRHGLFIAEGEKVIGELLAGGFEAEWLFETEPVLIVPAEKKITIIPDDLRRLSALSAANNCLGVFKMPTSKNLTSSGLIVALDDIRDPGNLGTIIRLCDWFGVEQIVCSAESADVYNPKCIQATMGSIARVSVNYLDIEEFLKRSKIPVFGTFMNGENIYTENLPQNAVLVFGNEANGISAGIGKFVEKRITIPRFGKLQMAESLNVAMAAAVVLSEFRRKV